MFQIVSPYFHAKILVLCARITQVVIFEVDKKINIFSTTKFFKVTVPFIIYLAVFNKKIYVLYYTNGPLIP